MGGATKKWDEAWWWYGRKCPHCEKAKRERERAEAQKEKVG